MPERLMECQFVSAMILVPPQFPDCPSTTKRRADGMGQNCRRSQDERTFSNQGEGST